MSKRSGKKENNEKDELELGEPKRSSIDMSDFRISPLSPRSARTLRCSSALSGVVAAYAAPAVETSSGGGALSSKGFVPAFIVAAPKMLGGASQIVSKIRVKCNGT